jgi:hypothetical protein
MTEEDWRRILPCELQALVKRWYEERRWWSSRFAAIVCTMGTKKDGSPARMKDVFPELAE